MDRRTFTCASLLIGMGLPSLARASRLARNPFALGIASGSPTSDGIVLWTRLAPEPQAADGGMPDTPVEVEWIIATDAGLKHPVRRGQAIAAPRWAHSVHVEIDGLSADTRYWYAFRCAGWTSPTGQTRTLPSDANQITDLRFVTVCCQNYTHGYFNPYRDMAALDPQFILHIGDYIYDKDFAGTVRPHETSAVPQTLTDFRRRHATYRADPDLQEAHRILPFIALPDNHDLDEDASPATRLRRQAALQAWIEHMPLRGTKNGLDIRIDSILSIGQLVSLYLLDTRLHRDVENTCISPRDAGFGIYRTACETVLDPSRTMLGGEQAQRMVAALKEDRTIWRSLVSTVPFAPVPILANGQRLRYDGGWDWYPAERQQVLAAATSRRAEGFVVLSGDIHSSWAFDLVGDDKLAKPIGAEIVTTSLTSPWIAPLADPMKAGAAGNPHVRHMAIGPHGFVYHRLTPERWDASVRTTTNLADRNSSVVELARISMKSDRPGISEVMEMTERG